MPSLKIQEGSEGVSCLRVFGWSPGPIVGPLNFTAKTKNSTVRLNSHSAVSPTYKYSLDSTTWQTYTMGTLITLSNIGDKVYFKGTRGTQTGSKYIQFALTGSLDAAGNVNSLLSENFEDITDLTGYGAYTFYNLFKSCTSLASAPILPATTLHNYCYSHMFNGCTGLISAPELPATTLKDHCYDCMFYNCSALVSAPVLPATTLKPYCYDGLFYGCRSLTSAPELPATTLADYCYELMFQNCTSLINAPALPATTLKQYCYEGMFYGCTSLEIAPELPAAALVQSCYYRMFYNCTSLQTAPALPATTLNGSCYNQMFYNCTSLQTAPELPATTLVSNCYNQMFYNCTSLQTAPELPATTLVSNCYCAMFQGCTLLNEVRCYATNIPVTAITAATGATTDWLSGVAPAGTFYKASGVVWPRSNNGIPTGWNAAVEEPLNFTAKTANSSVTLNKVGNLDTSYKYSLDNATWSDYTMGTAINLSNIGDKVYLKGSRSRQSGLDYLRFSMTGEISASGNVNSLLSEDFADIVEFELEHDGGEIFYRLFDGCTSLTSAPELPATTLAQSCYSSMFKGCTGLTSAPELPATTLDSNCYESMFEGCTSLQVAPELPATELAAFCYYRMFFGCTSLTSAPELPATVLIGLCYHSMFSGCRSLNEVKCYATDISAFDPTAFWLEGASSTGTFYKAPGVEWPRSTSGIPVGWDIEDIVDLSIPLNFTAKTSNATVKLVNSGGVSNIKYKYSLDNIAWRTYTVDQMITLSNIGDKVYFKGSHGSQYEAVYLRFALTGEVEADGNVNSLLSEEFKNIIDISYHSHAFNRLFSGCTSLVTAPALPATILSRNCYQWMFDGCTSLTSAPELPATKLASECYNYMFNRCTSLTSAPELPATTLANSCYSNMFYNCTSLTSAPELPATTLVNNCYRVMFYGCTKLNKVKCYATSISATDATYSWLANVSSTGTFYRAAGVSWPRTTSGVPSGWTLTNL